MNVQSHNVMGIYGNVWFHAFELNKGDSIPCHQHEHQHVTLIGNGSVMAMIDDKEAGVFRKGEACPVDKNVSHGYVALEDNTTLFCTFAVRAEGEFDPKSWDECLRLPKHIPLSSPDIHKRFFEEEAK